MNPFSFFLMDQFYRWIVARLHFVNIELVSSSTKVTSILIVTNMQSHRSDPWFPVPPSVFVRVCLCLSMFVFVRVCFCPSRPPQAGGPCRVPRTQAPLTGCAAQPEAEGGGRRSHRTPPHPLGATINHHEALCPP